MRATGSIELKARAQQIDSMMDRLYCGKIGSLGLLTQAKAGGMRGIETNLRQLPQIGAFLHDFSRGGPGAIHHKNHGLAILGKKCASAKRGELAKIGGLRPGIEQDREIARVFQDFIHTGIDCVIVTLDELGILQAKMGEPPGGDMLPGFPILNQNHKANLGIKGFDKAAVAIAFHMETLMAALADLGEVH